MTGSRAVLRALLPLATVTSLGAAGLGAIVGGEHVARAGDIAAAEVLFNDGQKLFDAGKVHEACDKFQESYAQDPAIGTMINLARCHEKEGKTASAWAEYKTVETLASRTNQAQRQQYAHDEAAKLEPTLHQLVLTVKFPVEGLEVARNSTSVGKALWGEKIPVDPGDVVLKASAPGKKSWNQTVHLAAGPGVDHFDIPKLDEAPVLAPAGGGGKDAVVVTSSGLGTGKIVGLALAGAGVIAAGIGVAFQLTALSEDSKSKTFTASANSEATACHVTIPDKTACPNSYQLYTHHDAAKSDEKVGVPLIAGGGALLIAGVVVFLVSGPSEASKKVEKSGLQLVPVWTPGQSGLAVLGTF